MRINIEDLYNSHSYAAAHGALPQQGRAFACLLWAALNGQQRLVIELYAKRGREGMSAVESALVAIWDSATKRRVRAPLYKPLDLGNGRKMPLSRKIVAAIALKAIEIVDLEDFEGSNHERARPLTTYELARLDERIQKAAGGRVPDVHVEVPLVAVPQHA